jgi:hypothetical protein
MGTISGQLARLQAASSLPRRAIWLTIVAMLVLLPGAGIPASRNITQAANAARSATALGARTAHVQPYANCPGSIGPC